MIDDALPSPYPVRLLIPDPLARRTTPLRGTEPRVHWLTESTRPEAAAARADVNRWYAQFPDHAGRFGDRLLGEVDVDHLQALDELFVHQLLRQVHDDVRYEVGGVGPDFRVFRDDTCVLGVEVLSLFQRDDWSRIEQAHRHLADELNSRLRPTSGYMVDFQIEDPTKRISPSKFASFVAAEIAKLPPHDTFVVPPMATRADLPRATYSEASGRVRVTFLPLRKNAPPISDSEARLVGTGPLIGGQINIAARLRDRLDRKAGGRYEIADVPFIVVACLRDVFYTDHEGLSAIHGSECVVIHADGSEPTLSRRNDGLFGVNQSGTQGRNRRVSAVAIVNALLPGQRPVADVALYDNPYAVQPVPEGALLANRRFTVLDTVADSLQLGWSQ